MHYCNALRNAWQYEFFKKFLLGYNDMLEGTFVIGDGVKCKHHIVTYAAMLNPDLKSLSEWQQLLEENGDEKNCLGKAEPTHVSGFNHSMEAYK
jgi:hypothetical protein